MTFFKFAHWRRLAVLCGSFGAIAVAPWAAHPVQAQNQTVVIGSPSADPVTVDLSVLNDRGSAGAGFRDGDLLFPGSRYKPGQRVILTPPGMVARRPVLRPPMRQRSAPARRALASRPTAQPQRQAQPQPRTAPRLQARPSAPPPPPEIAMPAPRAAPTPPVESKTASRPDAAPKPPVESKTASRPDAAPKPPSDAALAAIKPAAGPRNAAEPPKTAPPPRPALAAPEIKKRRETPAPSEAAIPPVPPAAPKATAKMDAVPPPPPPPEVSAAPRVPVTRESAPKAAAEAQTQVASIPRSGGAGSGTRQQIIFEPGSSNLAGAGKTTLAAIAKALAEDPARRVELKAYARGSDANVSQARRLSLSRALAVRSELMAQGVKPTRIDVRALGNRVPDGLPNRVDLTVFTR